MSWFSTPMKQPPINWRSASCFDTIRQGLLIALSEFEFDDDVEIRISTRKQNLVLTVSLMHFLPSSGTRAKVPYETEINVGVTDQSKDSMLEEIRNHIRAMCNKITEDKNLLKDKDRLQRISSFEV